MSDRGAMSRESDIEPCAAGRAADFGGRWTWPCLNQPARNALAFSNDIGGDWAPEVPFMHFCDSHMKQLIAAGLIEEPYVDSGEWDRRVGGRQDT